MNENMEFPGASGEDIEWLQDGFVTAIKVLSSGVEMTDNFYIINLGPRGSSKK